MEDSYVITNYMAGQQNRPSPFDNAPSIDSMSHNWRGPGFYSTKDKRFILLKDTTDDPPDQRSISAPSYARKPTPVPTATLRGYADDAWTRRWRGPGAGFYSPYCHTWSRENPGQNIASDSRLFYNEEDWLKYKFMCSKPILNGAKLVSGGIGEEVGDKLIRRRSREKNILSEYL